MAVLDPITIARFWSRVKVKSDFQCWEWTGANNSHGYGRCLRTAAHRVAYEIVNGPIPDGLIVRHRCDNRACCNPRHLVVGTNQDNANDAMERGRLPTGQRHPKTKLTDDNVIFIRRNVDRLSLKALASMFGVCKGTISYVRSGRSHKYTAH